MRTIRNLAGALDPGRLFVILDDMPVESPPAAARANLETFKRCWRCPVMPTAAEWSGLVRSAGLEIIAIDDLSPLSRPGGHEHVERNLRQGRAALPGRRRPLHDDRGQETGTRSADLT